MQKIVLLILVTCSLKNMALAQVETNNHRCNMKLSYTSYRTPDDISKFSKNHAITGDFDYSINKYLEIGGWLGWGFYKEGVSNEYGGTSLFLSNMFLYGVNGNINLIPMALNRKARFKVYLAGKLGANYKMSRENATPARGHYLEYAAFIGAAYYITRHIGAFAEGGLSNTSTFKYGLAIKF